MIKKKIGYVLIALFISIILGLGLQIYLQNNSKSNINPGKSQNTTNYNTKITVDQVEIWVEVADTQAKQSLGLSGREFLADGYGMIFPYSPPRQVAFWMPDMHFSIDILYISGGKVIQIYKNVPHYGKTPNTDQLPTYPSKIPVDLVLEVPAGFSQKNNIGIGSQVRL